MILLNTERLHSQLILEEGLRLVAYDDVTGLPIARGGRCRGKLTIGVGRNLDGNPLTELEREIIGHDARTQPITHAQAIMLLDHDIENCIYALERSLPWCEHITDEIRARVLVDLCFNMGIGKLLGFKNFLSNLRTGSYIAAGDDLKDSLWYKQVGSRGVRLVAMMRTGEDWKK